MAGRGQYEPYDDRARAGAVVVDAYGRPLDPGVEQFDEPYDEPYDDRDGLGGVGGLAVSGRSARRRRGAHIGPLSITPTRVTLLLALIGSVGFLGYAITVRDPSQIPLLASGAAVLGIVFAALAVGGAVSAVRAGREGSGGRAFAMALAGGVASVIAFGCLGAAIVLALVWRP
jgi:hypothetical protein